MAWYQTPNVSGAWGWHWTMNHYNPNTVDDAGRAEIASQVYPVIGPYDSRDPDVLDYQLGLMKLSGIDGVIVDWYGPDNYRDYALINAATHMLFDAVSRAGLLFAICYEDRSIGFRVSDGQIRPSRAIDHGREVVDYLATEWLQSPNYLVHAGRPVLFVFGNPPYFDTAEDWDGIFVNRKPRPLLVTEDDPVIADEPARFAWPPMSRAAGGELTPEALDSYLRDFYTNTAGDAFRVAAAFPGFHDIYAEAGAGVSYGYLDAADGATLRHTLDLALAADPDVIQLVTWNDYGEGTVLEPTREFGARYLEILQDARRASIEPGFAFVAADLDLPGRLLDLRRRYRSDPAVAPTLNAIAAAIRSGEVALARTLIAMLDP